MILLVTISTSSLLHIIQHLLLTVCLTTNATCFGQFKQTLSFHDYALKSIWKIFSNSDTTVFHLARDSLVHFIGLFAITAHVYNAATLTHLRAHGMKERHIGAAACRSSSGGGDTAGDG